MDDPARAYGLDGLPWWGVVATLMAIVLVRSHATYWLGRAVARGAELETQHRVGPRWWLRLLDRIDALARTPRAERGLALVHRWGPVAVAPAYLAVGLQTAVLLASGLVRMPYARFVPASLVGALAWAVVWSTVGLGAIWAATRSPWGLVGVALAVAALTSVIAVRRCRSGQPTAQGAPANDVGPARR